MFPFHACLYPETQPFGIVGVVVRMSIGVASHPGNKGLAALSARSPISQKLPPLLFKVGNCQNARAITQFVTQSLFMKLTH